MLPLSLNTYKFCINYIFNFSDSLLVKPEKISEYFNMQKSVPENEKIMVRLEEPFLLDFHRNIIFNVDYPGGASLPPGMPFFKGPDALADYLISKSIRYVAYAYANEANFQIKRLESRLSKNSHPWERTEAQHTFDFQDNLLKLGNFKRRIYDDGDIFVLDLLQQNN